MTQYEDHTTYKIQDAAEPEDKSANEGAVLRIGWDAHHIIVKRQASPSPGFNEEGWVVIDIDRKRLSRTLTDAEIQQRADLAHIATYSPDSAWKRL